MTDILYHLISRKSYSLGIPYPQTASLKTITYILPDINLDVRYDLIFFTQQQICFLFTAVFYYLCLTSQSVIRLQQTPVVTIQKDCTLCSYLLLLLLLSVDHVTDVTEILLCLGDEVVAVAVSDHPLGCFLPQQELQNAQQQLNNDMCVNISSLF